MSYRWPLLIVLSAVAMVAVFLAEVGPPVAPLVAVWFVLVCPGLPYVRLLRLGEPLTETLLAIALSLSIEALVGLALLAGSSWSSSRALGIVVIITLLGSLFDARRVFAERRLALAHRGSHGIPNATMNMTVIMTSAVFGVGAVVALRIAGFI